MLIRALTPEDAVTFQTLRLRGLRECPEAFASSFDEEAATPTAEIEKRLSARAGSAIFGAFLGDELVALTGLQREGMLKLAHKAFVWGVYVAPEARGKHIGEAVVRYALDFAYGPLGVRQVNLGVNTNNAAAVALYKKLGFVEYGLERGFLLVGGTLHDEFQMAHTTASVA